MTSGILPVNKPAGITSFDVVRYVRRATRERRVGHAGTLDPSATGVLLILLGQATRITEYLMDMPKVYRATVRLGVETTTYDTEGDLVSTAVVDVSEERLREALSAFVGAVMQVPPAHSAVKVDGERAYNRARRGEAPAMSARPVRIDSIDLLRFDSPDTEIVVQCGRGTYIRSLAHDLGEQLACGGHLTALERTRVGPFAVEGCADEKTLANAFEAGIWPDLVQPMDCGLMALPAITLDIEDEKDLRHGQAIDIGENAHADESVEARAYAEDGSLIGIICYEGATAMWRPRKTFAPGE